MDLVLNSLVGEFIPKSLSVLAPGGRFLEIGKREIWDQERANRVRSGVAYVAYDLAELASREPEQLQNVFQELTAALQAGELTALPRRVFPIQEVATAFRYMAQAKHIGKIVITQGRDGVGLLEEASPAFRPDRSYLITGGLGALGLQIAGWMVARGAALSFWSGAAAVRPTASLSWPSSATKARTSSRRRRTSRGPINWRRCWPIQPDQCPRWPVWYTRRAFWTMHCWRNKTGNGSTKCSRRRWQARGTCTP